jgi:maltokinase
MTRLPDPQVADQLLRYLTGARWFAGKGRQASLLSVTPLPWLTGANEFVDGSAAPAVRFEIVEVGYPDGPTEYYQLAVSYRLEAQPDLRHAEIGPTVVDDLGPAVAYDAAQDPPACRVILGALLAGRMLRGPDTSVQCHLENSAGLTTDVEPRVFTGQQSNTSVMFGEVAMLKLFRRLELGRNLDIEVHHALNAAEVSDVAGLFGWIEGSWVSESGSGPATLLRADLAMLVEKLADATDGWAFSLDRLAQGESFATEAEALGRALHGIHEALHHAFPTARVLGATTAGVMSDRLDQAATIAPSLLPYASGLRARFAELGEVTLDVQRVHGDFHLGQTLHTPGGWKIIDFEGEPVKTMAERLAPDSVWRDVGGMLRSFDYAAASVSNPAGGLDPQAWATECRAAFLKGYAEGDLSDSAAGLLRAYEADKAIYEVVYETRNRPDWVAIPLAAITKLADPSAATPTDQNNVEE